MEVGSRAAAAVRVAAVEDAVAKVGLEATAVGAASAEVGVATGLGWAVA